jgi:hypothetical protein
MSNVRRRKKLSMDDPATIVARRFEALGERCGASGRPTDLSRNEQIIWYLVATRCEIDMEGLASVFDQLLKEKELLFFIAALGELEEPELAAAFLRAHAALKRVGFYERSHAMCHQFPSELKEELDAIDRELSSGNKLWELDKKLVQLAIGAS